MMRKASLIFIFFLFTLPTIIFAARNTTESLEYKVSMSRPYTHYFDVEIRLRNYKNDEVDFKMPIWTPGSYLVREYSKNVERFEAINLVNQQQVSFRKTAKDTWNVKLGGVKELLIRYSVYANEGSVRMSYLNESHAFIMANSLLMYVDDLKNKSSILKLVIPEMWQNVSTSLTEIEGQKHAFYAPNYDILVDSPIEIGNHDIIKFTAAGVPHEIAMYGRVDYNENRLKRDIKKIVEESTEIFGDNPNEKYVFIIHNTSKRGGGLEHLSSTVLGVNRNTYLEDHYYNGFLSLVAHEYFHLWLVKRLKPVELEKLKYNREMYTDLLWVMEGLTSYFEEKIMLRCGFYDKNQFITNLIKNMAAQQNLAGSKIQSVAESSFDAWIKAYRKNENSSNTQVSYYSKGMLLGALLDLEIIHSSDGENSLDDVINDLYYQYYKKKDKGITAEDLKREAEKAGNVNLDRFFEDYIYGTADLENEKYLHYAGIGLIEINGDVNSKSIGISVKNEDGRLMIESIASGSAAYDGGLNVGDELIAIEGYRLSERNLKSVMNQFKVNEKVMVLYCRDGLTNEREIEIRRDQSVAYAYEFLSNPTKLQKNVFDAWLNK